MLIVMQAGATERQIADVTKAVNEMGLHAHSLPGATRSAIAITGNTWRD